MPKINVYLPDDLAESVKDLNIPVSAICQRALEVSVKRITSIRGFTIEDLQTERAAQFTERARAVIRIAAEDAGGAPITSLSLLNGLVAEGGNLALDVLRAMDIDPHEVAPYFHANGEAMGMEFADDAAGALELAVVEAVSLGHNYVGCEHLLIGMVAEPHGHAGSILRDKGADLKSTRRAVQTALAGIVHMKAQLQAKKPDVDATKALHLIMSRLDRLEKQVGIG